MKTKSKSLISIILSIMMVLSMIMFAIPANAATTDSDSVGATTYYLWYNNTNSNNPAEYKNCVTMQAEGSTYVGEIPTIGQNFSFLINTSKDTAKSSYVWTSQPTVTKDSSAGFDNWLNIYQYNGSIWYVQTYIENNATVKVTFTPNSTVYLSKADSTEDPTDPTDTTYYIGGRFSVKDSSGTIHKTFDTGSNTYAWNASCTNENFKFTADPDTEGLYYLDTNLTIAELSATLSENNTTAAQYFLIHTGSGDSGTWYGGSSSSLHSMQNKTESSPATLTKYTTGNSEAQLMKFSDTSNTSKDTVTLWLDTRSGVKLYYTTTSSAPATQGAHTITTGTSENGTLKFTGSGNTTEGTANAGDTVTVNVTPNSGYACTGITVSGVADVTTINSNSYTFVMPAQNVTVSATYEESTDKSAAIAGTNALWIDAAPDVNSTSTLIKWDNYKGTSHGTTTDYRFYIPKNVDLKNAVVYNGFSEAVTFGSSIPAGGSAVVSLSAGTTTGTAKGYITVYQGSTDAMFLYTSLDDVAYDLPTETGKGKDSTGTITKSSVKADGGTCITMTNDTSEPVFSDPMKLSSVKGRGNSSWEASHKFFGKYAFNMKLKKAVNLFGMDSKESDGARSWCLLANNADESNLRNALTYQLADELGLDYAPEFRFVDIYDNNVYMGSYLVTEKVDVGKDKLIKGEAFDDINKEPLADGEKIYENEDGWKLVGNGPGNAGSYRYVDIYKGTSVTTQPPYNKRGTYLLEFEIKDRTDSEASWFVSNQGQNVVVKSPEFATYNQVKFVQEKFNAMETAIYDNADVDTLSQYMDVESFATMYLIQELSGNLDSASTSYYIIYDCNVGRFVATPVWDYDMAYGQHANNTFKYAVGNNNAIQLSNPSAWIAKYKRIDKSEDSSPNKYSIQSQLASQNASFKSVIRYVWNNTFYPTIKKYYGENSQIDQWKSQISASMAMNETRWGFLSSEPLRDWWLADTGDTLDATVTYLETTWTKKRVEFLNAEFAKSEYPDTYTPATLATPTVKAYASDGTTELTGSVEAESTYIIKATTTDSGVTFHLYENDTEVDSNTTGIFTITATEGKHSYTVKTTSGNVTSTESATVKVTVTAKADPVLTGVTVRASATSVMLASTFTLTATPNPADMTCKYVFYKSTDSSVSNDDTVLTSTGNTATVTADTVGTFYYYVVATCNDTKKTSTPISVSTTNSATVIDKVTIWFKGTTLASLKPSYSVNGGNKTKMTSVSENGYIGTHYSGAYQFRWYEFELSDVTVGDSYTLTFTTAKSDMNATITLNFSTCPADKKMYFAVDNMQTGTEVTDITNNETAKSCFRSSVNMITNLTESDYDPLYAMQAINLSLLNTSGNLITKTCYLGDVDTDNRISVKDATEVQKMLAECSDLDSEYSMLGDFNADGMVNIKDATAIQRYTVGIY